MRRALLPTCRTVIPTVSEIKPKSPQPLLLLIDFLSMERKWRKTITLNAKDFSKPIEILYKCSLPCNPCHSTQEDRLLSHEQANAINGPGSVKHWCYQVFTSACSGFLAPYWCLPSRVHNHGLTYSYGSYSWFSVSLK